MQLIEIEDQAWCPVVVRDAMTDFLRFTMERFAPYAVAAPLLARALTRLGETRIVDLCSGGGGPWLDLVRRIPALGGPAVRVMVTDAYPNRAAQARLRAETDGAVSGHPDPVQAAAVPEELGGFRTLFTALHHFPPPVAREILAQAVRRGVGIGVFEITRRSLLALLGMLFLPLIVLLVTPFVRPFRWSRLLLTYLVPVIPLAVWFDGTVSCLRSYTPDELEQMTAAYHDGYEWNIGVIRSAPYLTMMTYAIGVPVVKR